MSAPRLRGGGLVMVSLAVHALAIVGVSALVLRTPVAPLFVDLTEDGAAAIETRPGGSAAISSRAEPAGGGAPARRAASASSGAVAPIPAAPDASASVSGTPAPGVEEPAPSPTMAADPAPPSADSVVEGKPNAAGPLAGGPASDSGPGRPAAAASESAVAGAGPGVSAPGGAWLALALPGDGRGAVPAEYGPYLLRFRRSVEDALVYPLAARRQGLAGRVELDVLLELDGRVTAVEVHTSSSHGVLDEAGLAAVRSLPPMPFPEGLPRRPLRIRLPLDFQLR